MLVKSSNAGPEAKVIAVGVLAFSASKTLGAGTDRLIRVETTRVTGMNRPSICAVHVWPAGGSGTCQRMVTTRPCPPS